MNITKLYIALCILIFPILSNATSNEKSIVDLSSKEIKEGDSIEITAPWQFYWNQYIFHGDSINSSAGEFVGSKLPWTEIPTSSKGYPAFGYGTYHTKVILPKRGSTDLAITLKRVKTEYAIYIDNKLASHMGNLTDYPNSLNDVSNTTGVVQFSVPLDQEAIDIYIHVSNATYYRGGLDQPPVLSYSQTASTNRMTQILAAAFTAGALLFMGIYHFGLWLKGRSNRISLYFSILAIAVGIRVFFTYKLFYLLVPFVTESIMLRCEIALAFTALPFLHIFISTVFPEEANRSMTRLSWIVWSSLMLVAVFGSLNLMGLALAPFKIYFVITLFHLIKMGWSATRNKREGSLLFSIGFLIALITGIHDVLFENNTIYGVGQPIFPFGVLTFVFIQFVLHAMRFSRAYRELEQLTNTLENQVEERTKELSIAHQIASKSHEETRLLSNAMTNLLEEERKSIARELHDDFGQTIRAAGLYADSIVKELKKESNLKLKDSIENAGRISSALMDVYNKNRSLLRRLRPEIIDTLGLKFAIEELLDNYRRNEFDIDFYCNADVTKLDNKQKITIYRILQESLTNIIKYAESNIIRVSLEEDSKQFTFKVSDQGKGFDIATARGIGLISMRERLAEIGGNLNVNSILNEGTTITATIPNNNLG